MKISLGNFDNFTGSLDPHVLQFGRGAAFFGGGVMLGIIVKTFLRIVILSIIISFFVIKGLEYKHILNVDWGVLNQLIGLRPSTTLHELALAAYSWAVKNLVESISALAGFIVGFNII